MKTHEEPSSMNKDISNIKEYDTIKKVEIHQNYPNPVYEETTIPVELFGDNKIYA